MSPFFINLSFSLNPFTPMGQNLDNIKDKNIEVFSSLMAQSVQTNTLLRTILDVLIETHLDGKSDEEQKKIEDWVNDRLNENADTAAGYLILSKD
jgi:hypothetical protein